MAEGILKKMLKDNKYENFEVSSAGVSTLDGAPASLLALEVSKERNVDLTRHRSRRLDKQILKRADLILTFSNEHEDYIRKMDKNALEKTYLLKAFPQSHSAQRDVPLLVSNMEKKEGVLYIKDPIGGTIDDYKRCFSEIEKEIERAFPDLISLAHKKNLKSRF
jgi:protein-tyrosine-phosphatase